jgi:PEP-CTERM motif-containing protein
VSVVRKTLLLLAILGLSRGVAEAAAVTVDQVLYDSTSVVDPSLLSGTVDMSLSGNVLTIILTNTSLDGAGSSAGILLTGVGFELPAGVSIGSGSANMGSSTAVNFVKPASGDVSSEWGYDNNPLNSGFFLNNGFLSYNTVVSSMVSMTTNQFAGGSLGQPPDLGGPDFGAISASETDAGGQEAIRSSILLTLYLTGTVPSDLVSQIDSHNVGISFGSPNAVPEPTSLSLLALGGSFVAAARRRRKRA